MNHLITSLVLIIPFLLFLMRRRNRNLRRTPPGSLGMPLIGQSLSLLHALRANTAEKWLAERVKKYGVVSKLSLFGKPTVFLHGQAANKLVFTGSDSMVAYQQPTSVRMILGDRNMMELSGHDHKRIRNALVSFLKPESLKQYVGKMDQEVRNHLQTHWQDKEHVKVLPLMRILTFNVICSLLFGVEGGPRRDKFLDHFQKMIEGILSVPLNLPFTVYSRSLKSSAIVQKMLKEVLHEKRLEPQEKGASPHQDLITWLRSMRDADGKEALTENEIIHNTMVVMAAGHDTTATLVTFILRLMAMEPTIYANVLKEQEEVAERRGSGDALTWEDLAKMKYTWRVALETLRMLSPVFGGFRKAMTDIEYGGYIIPRGWQIFWVAAMSHMDGSIFPEPSKFDPSRFEDSACIPPHCFIPFGGGQRICPGIEFARIETLVTVHYIVTQFTWKLCADTAFRRNPVPEPTEGLPIRISSRKLS